MDEKLLSKAQKKAVEVAFKRGFDQALNAKIQILAKREAHKYAEHHVQDIREELEKQIHQKVKKELPGLIAKYTKQLKLDIW